MISTTILATCGLIFGIASHAPSLNDDGRAFLDEGIKNISRISVKNGVQADVLVKLDEISKYAEAKPDEFAQYVDMVAPTCKQFLPQGEKL